MRIQHALCLILFLLVHSFSKAASAPKIEQWNRFEITLNCPYSGNGFTDVQLTATFSNRDTSIVVPGFYDGDGLFKIRFMPASLGKWTYLTQSNLAGLSGKTGQLTCIKPAKGNHGPVHVADTYYFRYADGTPYFSVGTTCYQWISQSAELQDQTIKSLAASPFNKIRMCIFPKWYIYNRTEPVSAAYANLTDTTYDFSRFNPAFWRNLENRIDELEKLGIQADIVLFHPYDKWGFATMELAGYDRYIRYAVARLSACRNVWWSIANEFDFMTIPPRKNHSGNMHPEDWDHFFQLIQKEDPYHHPIGIHNGTVWYDHTKPWVSHASIQNSRLEQGMNLREKYRKPVVYDECKYEGNIEAGWGQLSPQTMTQRFWIGAMNGCYVGHGECIKAPDDILWWGKGGVLRGESPKRIAFFRRFMEALPFIEMKPAHQGDSVFILSKPGSVYLAYALKPAEISLELTGKATYSVERIDTWNMSSEALPKVKAGLMHVNATSTDYLLKITAD